MKALVKEGKSLAVKDWPKPQINNPNNVLIRVVMAGICRTDIYVCYGQVKAKDPIIPGHEFSGIVEEVGKSVTNCKVGDRVAVMPLIACNKCNQCVDGNQINCPNSIMLGVDQDGAFAEFIVVPASSVYELPDNIGFQLGAYLEPICAALAVLKANINPKEKGLIYGENRISLLTKKIMLANGFSSISTYDPRKSSNLLEPNSYDYVIETLATSETISEMIKLVRPGGKIILKSRQHQPISLDFISIVKKEISFQAVNYGLFSDALELSNNKELSFTEMFGDIYPLEDFEQVFSQSTTDELLKRFFSLTS